VTSDPAGSPSESKLGEEADDLLAEQDQEGALSFVRAGRAEAFLLSRLASALRVAKLHSLDNVAAREVLDELQPTLAGFLGPRDRALVLVGEGKRVYVNGRLVRTGKTGGAWLDDFVDILSRSGAGGLALSGAWDLAATRALVAAFNITGAATEAARFQALRQNLSKIPLPALVQPFDQAAAAALAVEEEEGYTTEAQRAAFYFARLVTLAEAALVSVRQRRSPDVLSRHLRQTIMKIVDALERPLFEARLLGCGVAEPPAVEPLAAHAARVAVLSIVMGRLLGVQRGTLGDLGFAALFHDIGRAEQEHRLDAAKAGEAHETLAGHVQEAVRYALRGRTYATAGLLRLVVGLEHHRTADGVPEDEVLRAPHVFSRIVAVADAFDRLEHGLPWRKPVGPAEALKALSADPQRWEPCVVELLRDALGRTPRGTILQLRTGEVVVVVAGGARQGHRPIMRRLQLASGALDPEGKLAVLASREAVAAELDPDVSLDWRAAVLA
jgi:hypothetical protein